MTEPSTFLTEAEVVQLTGRRMKSRQITWLKAQGIAHWVNATGHPVVSRVAISGQRGQNEPPAQRGWTPRAIGA